MSCIQSREKFHTSDSKAVKIFDNLDSKVLQHHISWILKQKTISFHTLHFKAVKNYIVLVLKQC